jgi:hypothetical protein
MRRAGGWMLGLVVVAAMATGAWIALRPLYTRETITIGYFRSGVGRDPSNDAMFSGAQFALEEAGGRAGRFRVQFADFKTAYSKLPMVWIGTREALAEPGDVHSPRLCISLMDGLPHDDDGELRILATYEDQGRAAAEWAKSKGYSHVYLVQDVGGTKGGGIGELFQQAFPTSPGGAIDVGGPPDQWRELVDRILLYNPALLFYAGEEAPYSTAEPMFKTLREKGFAGTILMGEKEPEVSFLALPCRVPEGTLLISPIGPPSKEFAAKYEPATGRHAGPHGWVGYQAMKAALDVIDRAESAVEFQSILDRLGPIRRPCHLYRARNGRWEFEQEVK